MGILEDWERESTYSAASGKNLPYVVFQVTLKEKLLGTGSGNLTELEEVINNQAKKGYRLHSISTAHTDSKGFGGGDRIQATLVFERIDIEAILSKLQQTSEIIQDTDEYIKELNKPQVEEADDGDTIDPAWLIGDAFWVQCPNCGQKTPINTIKIVKRCSCCGCEAFRS